MSGAVIGFAGAIGGLGGVGINLALRQSYLTSGSATSAFWIFLAFYVLASAVTWATLRPPPHRWPPGSDRPGPPTRATRLGNGRVIAWKHGLNTQRSMSEPDWAPLTGFRVAVTSARRADELSALLSRRGATVTSAAAITMVPLPDDDELRAHTEALIDAPPDIVIATTGIGFRGWIAAADGWGLADELHRRAGKARIVSRGPKATGALRAAGLPEEWSPESESSREVLHYLVEGGIAGLRIAVQLHGATDDWDPFPEFLDELRAAGAEVVPIRVYRWHPAPRDGEFDQLVTGIADAEFDAVSFTSAPAVASMLMRADELGIDDRVLTALRTDVHAMCVGPVTARPLVRLGVPTRRPSGCGWARWPATSPTSCRCCSPARSGSPATCWRSAAPACWSTAWSRSYRPRGWRPSGRSRTGPARGVAVRPAGRAARQRHRHPRGRDGGAAAANRPGRQEHRVDRGQARLPAGGRRPDRSGTDRA